jgi:3-deoxy-D-manno-octulosonate 8-phosphate phosphatase (KDO 8-P phosphatase)
MNPKYKEKLTKIKAFAFDVDGVFANYFFTNTEGDFLRFMNAKDGFAVKYAIDSGYYVAIITAGTSESVKKRFTYIGVTDIYLNAQDKADAFEDFYFKYNLSPEEVLYMGDDLPDYEVMTKCGLPCCPSDASLEIKEISDYISDKTGGNGCVRDVIEQVMKVQKKWNYTDKFNKKIS